ncbi:hypothetical protein M409DRAFT_16484 [Zasmidium cellare ATCC 36951]|uniref:F-box domain-containing protein n=1 Tax=Zasmidium cellare ATCC 36951 TaxID=1080233 RepID=A0A6A6D489_ZASCE|nr:uncharacterized protein M409DRAFT_16484 [Zasmidium cellare ATCC 36951]KAF2174217.1 hypothetical protein M409DRAFT_16484 [Zasmidium cellare ATCC 36951]
MADTANGLAGPKLAAIPELVEYILLELPLRDVLLAQRIDRTWGDIITGSSKLQKALFFRPSVDHTLRMRGLSDYTKSPCDCKNAPKRPLATHLGRPVRTKDLCWARDETDTNHYAVAINPFVWSKGRPDSFLDIEEGIEALMKTTGQGDSLRRMLLTQPPVETIILYTTSALVHMISRKPGACGVTVADVLDAVATFNDYYNLKMDVLKCLKEYVKGQLEEDEYYSTESDLED